MEISLVFPTIRLRICEEITDDHLRVRMASLWGIVASSVTGYFEEYPNQTLLLGLAQEKRMRILPSPSLLHPMSER